MSAEFKIPEEVLRILRVLRKAGYESYIVGGSVRDILRDEKPKDWDVTTSAKPEEILKLFPESFYENKFLTVTVKTDSSAEELKEIEITTFRSEGKYTDKRHPDKVNFAETLKEDLTRRDFTINAMALDVKSKSENPVFELIDPFGGQNDLEKKIIRAVGSPKERFQEDALRMLRAARFAAQLDFGIEEKTRGSVRKLSGGLEFIAKERIREEFVKIIMAPQAKKGVELLRDTGLLKHIMPELEEGIGIDQRGPHKFQVWEHNLKALEYACRQNWSLKVRLAALLHDVGKPRTRERRGGIWAFYGHDVVGAKMAFTILTRLCFSAKETENIANLVRWHLFNYRLRRDDQFAADMRAMGENPEEKDIEDSEEDTQDTTDSAIRRLIRRVGAEAMPDLVKVRVCDRIATGVPKAVPYRLRHFQFRVEKILREGEATNVGMLKIRGGDIMEALSVSPGPKIGYVLDALLEEVLDEPEKNDKKYLFSRAKELGEKTDEELRRLREQSRDKIGDMEKNREEEIKKKYKVK